MRSSKELLDGLRLERMTNGGQKWSGRFTHIAIAVIIAVPIIGYITFAAGQGEESRALGPMSTQADPSVSATSVLQASGYVVARRAATVSSRVTGRVSKVMIEEGQYVESGEVIAHLDRIDADANYRLQLSRVASARAKLVQHEAELRHAVEEELRMRSLVKSQVVSKSTHDLSVSRRDSLKAQRDTALADISTALAQVKIAEIGVDDTIVKSPFAGVVVAKAAQPGEIVSPLSAGGGFTRTGIGTIVDMTSLEIEVEVGEAYISRVEPDMRASIALTAYPNEYFPGIVTAIVPAADRGKATVRVRVAFLELDPRILPDMGVSVGFLDGTSEVVER
jgi:RND family efflux transporter MFP subunit